jgi:hemerythrin-like domain-containing protein
MVTILENVCEKLQAKELVNPDYLQCIVEFIRAFVDECHHGKEEDLLFPAIHPIGKASQ